MDNSTDSWLALETTPDAVPLQLEDGQSTYKRTRHPRASDGDGHYGLHLDEVGAATRWPLMPGRHRAG
ncbi:hypothetical protein WJX84_006671 [Apatococcus fuscideae]|uniref:Uncharacterized protein n=1 Tax=Apatococcus fuscideae TaxID=2026836 RepID=A0AAW1T2Z7_9CHLO